MSEAPPPGEMILYTTEDGEVRIECRFVDETLWLTQALMATLFDRDVRTINEHLVNIFDEGEIDPQRTIRKFRMVRPEGASQREVARVIEHYSLDAVLAVGYRIRSPRGVQFRSWASKILSDYLVKGFALDDRRLKNPPTGKEAPPDRFDELLSRIRDIRASEKRMYARVRDLWSMAADYKATAQQDTRLFFQKMQNKLHFAATGQTAAEIIAHRADVAQPNMGLMTFAGERVTKADVTVAKNYLTDREIDELNRIVVMWLDFAEDQTRRRQEIFLRNWEERLDAFLQFNNRDVLQGAGSVTKEGADAAAEAAYDDYAKRRRALAEAEGERRLIESLTDAMPQTPPKK